MHLMARRNFLLLEILLSIAVIALFAPLLMRSVVGQYRRQTSRLEAFERRRIADWTFSEVKELLLKHGILWQQLPKKGEKPFVLSLSDVSIEIPQFASKKIPRRCTLKCKREKEGKQQEIYRIYELEVAFQKDPPKKKEERYLYSLLVTRSTPPPL